MKFIYLLLISNIAPLAFSQGSDLVNMIFDNYTRPKLTRLEYIENEDEIKINCDDIEIIIHSSKYNRIQLVEIVKDKISLYSFYSKYVINPRYLSAIYHIQLSSVNPHTILLVAYPEGASGISANMTFGVLFNIENRNYQYISTWGMVDENFVDIDLDGNFEFVSMDYHVSNGEPSLIANIFSSDISGLYTINDSLVENNIFVLFLSDFRVEKPDLYQPGIELMRCPDVFKKNYYPNTAGKRNSIRKMNKTGQTQ